MSKRRNVVFMFDGTAQKREGVAAKYLSNVGRLSKIIPERSLDGMKQALYYYDGVGVREGEELDGQVWGRYLYNRIIEAYLDLQQEVFDAERKDRGLHLYVSGFSRGAHAARWFSSLISAVGVPRMGVSENKGLDAFNRKNEVAARKMLADGLMLPCPPIEMLGVWDTVDATIGDNFDATVVPEKVANVYHAMALNEKRDIFTVERFGVGCGANEVWFNGSHTDVGGGYENANLSKITFAWMCEKFVRHGLFLDDGWTLPKEFDFTKCEYNESNTFWWKVLNVLQTAHKEVDREVRVGDRLHWSVRTMNDKFASIAPQMPPIDQLEFTSKEEEMETAIV